MGDYTKLLYIPKHKPSAQFRLICFPYAGGNISTYMKWLGTIHHNVELMLVQLPGRTFRFADPPYESMDQLVDDILSSLEIFDYKPSMFFGHSLGAKIAYALTEKLFSSHKNLPVHLFISGSSAQFASLSDTPIYRLPDDQLVEKLRSLNGTDEALLQNGDIMSLMLPTLRSDLKIAETYHNSSQVELPTKVSIFCGKEDRWINGDVGAWSGLFTSTTGVHWFDGGHFFIEKENARVAEKVNSIIEEEV